MDEEVGSLLSQPPRWRALQLDKGGFNHDLFMVAHLFDEHLEGLSTSQGGHMTVTRRS